MENTRTSGSSPSTDSRQDDAERWICWSGRWHLQTGVFDSGTIGTACGAWTWGGRGAVLDTFPGEGACKKCAKIWEARS